MRILFQRIRKWNSNHLCSYINGFRIHRTSGFQDNAMHKDVNHFSGLFQRGIANMDSFHLITFHRLTVELRFIFNQSKDVFFSRRYTVYWVHQCTKYKTGGVPVKNVWKLCIAVQKGFFLKKNRIFSNFVFWNFQKSQKIFFINLWKDRKFFSKILQKMILNCNINMFNLSWHSNYF